MPVPNPHYNPDWKALYEFHDAGRTRCRKEMDEYHAAGKHDPGHLQQLSDQFDEHHEACLENFRIRFETVQEYAEWLFSTFKTDIGASVRVPTFVPDIDSFTSIEQVNATWKSCNDAAVESGKIKRGSMKTGRIDGKDLFEEGPDRTLYRHDRVFTAGEVFNNNPYHLWGDRGASALLVADVRSNAIHISLMEQFHVHSGPSVTNHIELIASCLYREINENIKAAQSRNAADAQQTGGKQPGLLSHVMQRVAGMFVQSAPAEKSGYRPDQLHFYIHVPPECGMNGRERFNRISFKSCRNGNYEGADWERLDVIPDYVQKARFQLAPLQAVSYPALKNG